MILDPKGRPIHRRPGYLSVYEAEEPKGPLLVTVVGFRVEPQPEESEEVPEKRFPKQPEEPEEDPKES